MHAARAEGVWIYEPDGRRLLDAYNNVPVVGHCHPRVTEAVVRQTRLGATNARYLAEPLIELAERLLATFPPEAASTRCCSSTPAARRTTSPGGSRPE